MMECKKALQENAGDMEKSEEYLRVKGIAKASQRAGKQTSEGLITSYIHHNGKVGVMVEINCETDFVARTDDFKQLGRELALHIAHAAPMAVDRDGIPEDTLVVERRIAEEQAKASGKPEAIVQRIAEGKVEAFIKDKTLVNQLWRDTKKSIGDLIKEASAKVGENIQV